MPVLYPRPLTYFAKGGISLEAPPLPVKLVSKYYLTN